MRSPAVLEIRAGFHVVPRKWGERREGTLAQQRAIFAQIIHRRARDGGVKVDVIGVDACLQIMASPPLPRRQVTRDIAFHTLRLAGEILEKTALRMLRRKFEGAVA